MPGYTPVPGRNWIVEGGIYVIANIRGGGEYGPTWHSQAQKAGRHLVYEDFSSVAKDLVARGLTTVAQLGAMGGSNGGLLMGVMLTRYPELFGALVCQVPLIDMRRYHTMLAGASWVAEYGNPDDPEQWAFMEPFFRTRTSAPTSSTRPSLITTSTRDDRVHPGHARKFAAILEQTGHSDVWYYENIEGGLRWLREQQAGGVPVRPSPSNSSGNNWVLDLGILRLVPLSHNPRQPCGGPNGHRLCAPARRSATACPRRSQAVQRRRDAFCTTPFLWAYEQAPGLIGSVGPGETSRRNSSASGWPIWMRRCTPITSPRTNSSGTDSNSVPQLRLRRPNARTPRQVSELLAETELLLTAWRSNADPATGEKLTDAYTRMLGVLTVHLRREVVEVVPVVERVITQKNGPGWPNTASTRSPRAVCCRSWGCLANSSPADRAEFFAAVPPPVRLLWRITGRRQFAKQYRQLFPGQPVPETI